MNPATALARVLVDELIRGGVREAVLAPGSRSAPLAFALHDADRAGRLRLHVRIDERSAGFLALGLAAAGGVAVPVVTTSGTATANLHPAVLEAAHADVPLLVLTADRPPELRDTGANQTVDQVGLYGAAVRAFAEVGTPSARVGENAYWRALVCRLLAAASGSLGGRPGPVHGNVAFREPLVPDPDGAGEPWPEALDGRPAGAPWTALAPTWPATRPVDDLPARTVVVLGSGPAADARAAAELALARGWPVIAEPTAHPDAGPCVVAGGDLVPGVGHFLDAHRPDRVLVVGRPTLSRAVGRLIASAPADVVGAHGRWSDPARAAARALSGVPRADGGEIAAGWLAEWQSAGAAAAAAVARLLAEQPALTEPAAAQTITLALQAGELLVVGSSKPVRDLFLAAPGPGVRVLANRGAAGIDGLVSTAVGAALAHQAGGGGRAVALLGDLTFLHDSGGLVLGPLERRPNLTIVVVNNDGGAIFGLLEQGSADHADAFERVFGTPHGVDLAALCAATGTPHRRVTTVAELAQALRPAPGLRVVELRTDRAAAVGLDRDLHLAAAAALADSGQHGSDRGIG